MIYASSLEQKFWIATILFVIVLFLWTEQAPSWMEGALWKVIVQKAVAFGSRPGDSSSERGSEGDCWWWNAANAQLQDC